MDDEAEIFAVAGAKGGIGKTTTSINIAAALSLLRGEILVIECDIAMANVVDFLKLDMTANSDPTLHDVLGGSMPVRNAIYSSPGDFDIIPSGVTLEGYVEADPKALSQAVSEIRAMYDIILLDTGAGLSYESVIPLKIADQTILVSSPRVASVRDVRKTKKLAELAGTQIAGIAFVKSGTGKAPPPERIAAFLEVDVLGHIPQDENVPIAQDNGMPVVIENENCPASRAYREIAARLQSPLTKEINTTEQDDTTHDTEGSVRISGQDSIIDEAALDPSDNSEE